MTALAVRSAWHHYGKVPTLAGIEFTLESGITALLGGSGSGKTTLLRCIAGHETLSRGSIAIAGVTVDDGEVFRGPGERGLGMVFQDLALFPHLTVAENTGFGLRHSPAGERQRRVADMLELVGLADFAERLPAELSGGQQQRVALARAIAPEPPLLLLDEPFTALDTELRERLQEDIARILRQCELSCLLVTHDPQEALAMADQVLVMHEGKTLQQGEPQQVRDYPGSPRVMGMFGRTSRLPARIRQGELSSALGDWEEPRRDDADGYITVREDGISLRPAGDGQRTARILERYPRGVACRYRLRLADGSEVWALQPGRAQWRAGEDCGIDCEPRLALFSEASAST